MDNERFGSGYHLSLDIKDEKQHHLTTQAA